jgi:hypothetical protein
MSKSSTGQRGRATSAHRSRSLFAIFAKLPAGVNAALTAGIVAAIGVVSSFATGSQSSVLWWVALVVLVIVAAGLAVAASAHASLVPPEVTKTMEEQTRAVRDQTRALEQTRAASIKPLLRLSSLEAAPHRQGLAGGEIAVSKVGDETLLEIAVGNGGQGAARITGATIVPMFVSRADLDVFVGEQGYEEGHAWTGGCSPGSAAPNEHATVWFSGAADPDSIDALWGRLTRLLGSNRCEAKIDYQDVEGHQQASLIVTIGRTLPAEGDSTPRYVVLDTKSDVCEALVPISVPER